MPISRTFYIRQRTRSVAVANIQDAKLAVDWLLKNRKTLTPELEPILAQMQQAIMGYVSPRLAFELHS